MAKIKSSPIDTKTVRGKLWRHKFYYIIILPIVLVVTYLIVCQVPRYYVSNTVLAPEFSGSGVSGGLSSLASSIGLGSLSKIGDESDAINVDMYPDLFKSNDFLRNLMDVEVTTNDKSYKGTYYEYLETRTQSAPWEKWMSALKQKFSDKPVDKTKTIPSKLNLFNLTEKQSGVFGGVKEKIKCSVDKKTAVISISVQDQDPLVAATIANECSKKLQVFIMDYRTKKARKDFEYYKNLCDEARAEYDNERKVYAVMADADMDVILPSVTQELEEQENVMQLAYDKYTSLYGQMQMARAKLQEVTPVITVIESATVAVKPAGPKRMLIAIGVTVVVMLMMFFISVQSILKD